MSEAGGGQGSFNTWLGGPDPCVKGVKDMERLKSTGKPQKGFHMKVDVI